jgi:hypothetical protein
MAAEAYLINSDAAIVGMGGFSGQDPAPTVATLTQWVQQGQLRFVLSSGQDSRGDGLPDGTGRDAVSTQRSQWVQQHCAVVNPDTYGGSAPTRRNPTRPSEGPAVLYDCQPR